jgi:hypothetical protein
MAYKLPRVSNEILKSDGLLVVSLRIHASLAPKEYNLAASIPVLENLSL